MKRFTETEKWRDPWFQKLNRESRILWLWLCDRVDNAGVVDICWPICNAETGGEFSEQTMKDFGDRVEMLEGGKWWLPKFIHFQFGNLSSISKVHQSVEKLLNKYSLSDRVSHSLCNRLKDKDKRKDKRKDKDKPEFAKPSLADVKAYMLEVGMPDKAHSFLDHYEAKGWVVGKSPMKDWKASVRTWKQTWLERSGAQRPAAALRPSPLAEEAQ